jgi:hypothetical protein
MTEFVEEKPLTSTEHAEAFIIADESRDRIEFLPSFDDIERNFRDGVSMIGPTGGGKSSFATVVYCIMRGIYEEIFLANGGEDSFTKGIWAVNIAKKIAGADRDILDVFDCEGVQNTNASHYLSMVAMTLGKVLVICNRDARAVIAASLLRDLDAALSMMQDLGIIFPLPAIYFPVRVGAETIDIFNCKAVPIVELPTLIKRKFPRLEHATIRTYSLPIVQDNKEPRLSEEYRAAVAQLVQEWKTVPSDIGMVERCRYTRMIVEALNNKSPEMAAEINKRFLMDAAEKVFGQQMASATEMVRSEHAARDPLASLNQTYSDYLLYREKSFLSSFRDAIVRSPYYRVEFEGLVEIKYYARCNLTVGDSVKDLYEVSRQQLAAALKVTGQRLADASEDEFRTFVAQKLSNAAKAVIVDVATKNVFEASLVLPKNVEQEIIAKQQSLCNAIRQLEGFQEPPQFLGSTDYRAQWSVLQTELRVQWETLERKRRDEELRRQQEAEAERLRKQKLANEQAAKIEAKTTEFRLFVSTQLTAFEGSINLKVSKTALNQALELSRAVCLVIENKKTEIRNSLKQENIAEPAGFLATVDYKQMWTAKASNLRLCWEQAEHEKLRAAQELIAKQAKSLKAFNTKITNLEDDYSEFLRSEVFNAASNVPFHGDLTLPNAVVSALTNKKIQLREILWVRNLTVFGSMTCSSCNTTNITDRVTHGSPNCIPTSMLFWVDGPTKSVVCDGCNEVLKVSRFYCGRCSHLLDCQAVPF